MLLQFGNLALQLVVVRLHDLEFHNILQRLGQLLTDATVLNLEFLVGLSLLRGRL